MQNDLIPQTLHSDFNQFLHELTQLGHQVPTHYLNCQNQIFSQTRAMPLTFRCKSCLKY